MLQRWLVLVAVPAAMAAPASGAFAASTTTERISVNPRGIQGNGDSASVSISANGRWIAFVSTATNLGKRRHRTPPGQRAPGYLWVHDRVKDRNRRLVKVPYPDFYLPTAISADGRYVAYGQPFSKL